MGEWMARAGVVYRLGRKRANSRRCTTRTLETKAWSTPSATTIRLLGYSYSSSDA